jgi:hypothetical protein
MGTIPEDDVMVLLSSLMATPNSATSDAQHMPSI